MANASHREEYEMEEVRWRAIKTYPLTDQAESTRKTTVSVLAEYNSPFSDQQPL